MNEGPLKGPVDIYNANENDMVTEWMRLLWELSRGVPVQWVIAFQRNTGERYKISTCFAGQENIDFGFSVRKAILTALNEQMSCPFPEGMRAVVGGAEPSPGGGPTNNEGEKSE